jgi:hypothetical protein
VREDDQTHQALKLMGQSIGIVALGRRIVLIEGEHGSLDKQTYGAILKGKYPNLVLVPSGGRGQVQSFGMLVERILGHSVWGVEFFMLCDRDAVPAVSDQLTIEATAKGRLKLLNRYHLENYFLDEDTIAAMFSALEPSDSWLVSPEQIRNRLQDIARSFISYAAALIVAGYFRERVGNIDIMPKDCHGKTAQQLTDLLLATAQQEEVRISGAIAEKEIRQYTIETLKKLDNSVSPGSAEWKIHFPGRIVLKTFCSTQHANFDFGRFKIGFLKASEGRTPNPFSEIEHIFEEFSRA